MIISLRPLNVGEVDAAIGTDYALCLISAVLATIVGVADAIGDMRHDPGIGEWIGSVGFGISQGLGVGVVVLADFRLH